VGKLGLFKKLRRVISFNTIIKPIT